jgi:cytochrome c1
MRRTLRTMLLVGLVALALVACAPLARTVSRGGDDGLGFSDETYFAGPDDRGSVDFRLAGGSARRGAELIVEAGCDACHVIPGIITARSFAGPPLLAWPARRYIAGSTPNDFQNLVTWLLDPQAMRPGTAMPDTGLTEQEARDVAAYLFSLETTPGARQHFGN